MRTTVVNFDVQDRHGVIAVIRTVAVGTSTLRQALSDSGARADKDYWHFIESSEQTPEVVVVPKVRPAYLKFSRHWGSK